MANLLEQDPIYISVEDYKDTTSITYLETASDEEIKAIIYNAQLTIDDYIIAYGCKFDLTQELIFPEDIDGVSNLPLDISIATVYVGDAFYSDQAASSVSGNIKSEKSGPRSIEYFDSAADSSVYINQKAKIILDRYRLGFLKISI